MNLQLIPRHDTIPAFDPCAIAVQQIEYGGIYRDGEITEELIGEILQQIPSGIETILYLDPDGEDNWMEMLSDGEWLALGFCGDFGQNNFYSYNPAFAGVTERTPLLSEGQSPIAKELAIQDMDAGVKAVEYFIRTGGFYPGIDWAHQL